VRAAAGLAIVVAGLLLALTYLLQRGAAPDAALHQRTLEALHEVVLNEATLQRDVLSTRAGLLGTYDPLVRATAGLRAATAELQAAAAIADGAAAAGIARRHGELAAAVAAQEDLVEAFKSDNALLQNSLRYFAHAIDRLGDPRRDPGEPDLAEVAVLAGAMLRFAGGPDAEGAARLERSLERLAALPAAAARRDDVAAVVLHGRLVAAMLPAVDAAVARLLAAPAGGRARALQAAYLEQHARAEARAALSRVLLYAAAVGLLAYLVHLVLRLRRAARSLQARLRLEGLVAGIAVGFVGAPRERIADSIGAALGRLAEELGADRAHLVLPAAEGLAGAARTFRWPGDGAPSPGPPAMPDPGAGGRGRGELEPLVVPSVAAMPPGPARTELEGRGVRSWIHVPLRRGGERIGFLGLEAARGGRGWREEDAALLSTAGEIFANALERERAAAERQALEAALRQAQRMEAVGTLAGGIAHDFNNILGAIMGYAEMALEELPRGGRTREHVRQVLKAGERARGVVDQILAFSRRAEPERRPVRLRAVCEEAVDLLRASLPATVAIELRVAGTANDAVVLGDAGRLQLVVVNLCTNAAQAMDGRGLLALALDTVEAERELALSHGTVSAGRHVRLAVTDTGGGIDAATAERIFEPFFTTKGPGGGTGLGLATVHAVVADHGGALNLRSRPGAGSTFEVYLPRTEAPAAAEPEDAIDAAASPLPRGRGEAVLLVDDEEPLVRLGEEMLAALGYEPVGFGSAPRALAAFRADPGRFDLALTDEVMPEMTGTRLAAELRRLRPDLPVVLMTGYAGAVPPERLRAAGVREVLRKPLALRTVAEALSRQLRPGDAPRPAA
jgi:signal transduction histidine kinase/ActR/RegA family two-component response regulator